MTDLPDTTRTQLRRLQEAFWRRLPDFVKRRIIWPRSAPKNEWHSFDRQPWKYPWLAAPNIRNFRAFSDGRSGRIRSNTIAPNYGELHTGRFRGSQGSKWRHNKKCKKKGRSAQRLAIECKLDCHQICLDDGIISKSNFGTSAIENKESYLSNLVFLLVI